jgi:hypothetical protein
MSKAAKIIFIDPFGRQGAHPRFNSCLLSGIAMSPLSAHAILLGPLAMIGEKRLDRIVVFINCLLILIFLVIEKFKTGNTRVLVLAWPNKMFWVLVLASNIKFRIVVLVHNNLERSALGRPISAEEIDLIVMDSGLITELRKRFDAKSVKILDHPIFSPELTNFTMLRKQRRLVVYSFGKKSSAQEVFLCAKRLSFDVKHRGAELWEGISSYPILDSLNEYFAYLYQCAGLVVAPCAEYRKSASGFLADAIGLGIPLFLPADFILRFSFLSKRDGVQIYFYSDLIELEVLLRSKCGLELLHRSSLHRENAQAKDDLNKSFFTGLAASVYD